MIDADASLMSAMGRMRTGHSDDEARTDRQPAVSVATAHGNGRDEWQADIADRMIGEMGTPSVPRTAIGLLLAFVTIACDTASPKPITVDEFISQIDRLNGQTVNVTGYLGECYELSCHLYRSKAESEDVDRAMFAMRAALDEGATDVSGFQFPSHPAVSIGAGSQFFEMLTYFYEAEYVVVTGKASNRCRSNERFCFDRAGDLDPVTIRSASAPS